MAHQDARNLVVEDVENEPYPHINSETIHEGPRNGKEPRLFSKHMVKSQIAPGDNLVVEEINIQIEGKSLQSATIGRKNIF